MENFGISLQLSPEQLKREFYALFANQEFFFWDQESNNDVPENAVLFCISSNRSEFPTKVNI